MAIRTTRSHKQSDYRDPLAIHHHSHYPGGQTQCRQPSEVTWHSALTVRAPLTGNGGTDHNNYYSPSLVDSLFMPLSSESCGHELWNKMRSSSARHQFVFPSDRSLPSRRQWRPKLHPPKWQTTVAGLEPLWGADLRCDLRPPCRGLPLVQSIQFAASFVCVQTFFLPRRMDVGGISECPIWSLHGVLEIMGFSSERTRSQSVALLFGKLLVSR